MAIPLGSMGLSAVSDCVIFPDHTHYFWVLLMRTAMALTSLHICLV